MKDIKFLLLSALYCGLVRVHALIDEHSDNESPVIKRTRPAYALALGADLLNSTQCRSDLNDFRFAVDHRILWSMKMLDSSGRPKPGFVYGNNYWLGSRNQCDEVSNQVPLALAAKELFNNSKYRNPEEEFPPFELNYFVAHFRHNSTVQYHMELPNENLVTLGLCLPASCTTSDIGLIIKKMFRDRTLLIGDLYFADFRLTDVKDLQNDRHWIMNGKMTFIGCLLGLSFILMLAGTLYDVTVHQKYLKAKNKFLLHENNTTTFTLDEPEAQRFASLQESSIGKALLCFSIYINTMKIFNRKVTRDSVPQIHGLKFLGMVWAIMAHTLLYAIDYIDNKAVVLRKMEGFVVQIISNSALTVDTFFFCSGFLLSYGQLNARRNKEECGPINWIVEITEFFIRLLKRFIRLTPAYMMTIGIAELQSRWYQKTSEFYMEERHYETCAKYWWRNLLYIHTFFGLKSMCLSWSWYLSNDMQYFIIGSILIILSTILDNQYYLADVLYFPPWTRIGPYLVGLATGYIIIKLNNKLPLKKRTVAICWCLGSSCNLLVLFGLWEKQIPLLSAALYAALSRTVWAVGLAWIVIACQTKHGGVVCQVLSFNGWAPLSRLSYCAYLLNPLIISSVYLNSETSNHFDILPTVMMFMGYVIGSFFCAYALSLMMEMPYILLMQQFINRRARRNK